MRDIDICEIGISTSSQVWVSDSTRFGLDLREWVKGDSDNKGYGNYRLRFMIKLPTVCWPFWDRESWLETWFQTIFYFFFGKGDSRKIIRILWETLPSSTLYNVQKIMAPFSKTILATKRLRYINHSMGSYLNPDQRISHSSHYVEGLNFWSYNGFLGISLPGTRVGGFLYSTGDSNIELVVRPDWSTNPISGCAVLRTVPLEFGNVFSVTEQREDRSL